MLREFCILMWGIDWHASEGKISILNHTEWQAVTSPVLGNISCGNCTSISMEVHKNPLRETEVQSLQGCSCPKLQQGWKCSLGKCIPQWILSGNSIFGNIAGSVQGQVELGLEQPGLWKVPWQGQDWVCFKFLQTQTILGFMLRFYEVLRKLIRFKWSGVWQRDVWCKSFRVMNFSNRIMEKFGFEETSKLISFQPSAVGDWWCSVWNSSWVEGGNQLPCRSCPPKGQCSASGSIGSHSMAALSVISWQTPAANLPIDFGLGTPGAVQSLIKSEEFSFRAI